MRVKNYLNEFSWMPLIRASKLLGTPVIYAKSNEYTHTNPAILTSTLGERIYDDWLYYHQDMLRGLMGYSIDKTQRPKPATEDYGLTPACPHFKNNTKNIAR